MIVVVLDRITHMWGSQGFQGRPVMGTGCGQAKRRTVRVAVSTVDMWIGICGQDSLTTHPSRRGDKFIHGRGTYPQISLLIHTYGAVIHRGARGWC